MSRGRRHVLACLASDTLQRRAAMKPDKLSGSCPDSPGGQRTPLREGLSVRLSDCPDPLTSNDTTKAFKDAYKRRIERAVLAFRARPRGPRWSGPWRSRRRVTTAGVDR